MLGFAQVPVLSVFGGPNLKSTIDVRILTLLRGITTSHSSSELPTDRQLAVCEQ